MVVNIANDYWTSRLGWQQEVHEQVCWRALESTACTSPRATQLGILKIATGHIAAGHKLCQWKHQGDSMCPLCGEDESVDHVFQCNYQFAYKYWEAGISELEMFLKRKQTAPTITPHLTNALWEWIQGVERPGGAYIAYLKRAMVV